METHSHKITHVVSGCGWQNGTPPPRREVLNPGAREDVMLHGKGDQRRRQIQVTNQLTLKLNKMNPVESQGSFKCGGGVLDQSGSERHDERHHGLEDGGRRSHGMWAGSRS